MDRVISQEILQKYRSGISISKLSKQYNISAYHITKVLKSNGISIRKDNGCKLCLDVSLINNMYDNGESTYDIAKRFGCSDETIRKIVNTRSISECNKLRGQDIISKISASCKAKWQDPEYVANVKSATGSARFKQVQRENSVKNYHKSLGKFIASEQGRRKLSLMAKEKWKDQEYRLANLPNTLSNSYIGGQAMKLAASDPKRREAIADKARKASVNSRILQSSMGVSSIQRQLYYILETSGISYIKEGEHTAVGGFYVVDCIIPRQQNMCRDLIVEVQGEYWHSLPSTVSKDKAKSTYIRRHTDYDLLCINELEMKSFDKVVSLLMGYGITVVEHTFRVSDIEIRKISESDLVDFYSIFHYSSTVRKCAISYGVYHNGVLMAAISYSYPIRKQISSSFNAKPNQVMEISRMARRTNIKCKNLLSYFISKSKKMLLLIKPDVRIIISYSDDTYGHTGSVYKASGFVNDKIVEPDYNYMSGDVLIHKKTVWDMAKRMKYSECEYAEKHNLVKIVGSFKKRWVLLVN